MQLLILRRHFPLPALFIHYALLVSLTSRVHSYHIQCDIPASTSKNLETLDLWVDHTPWSSLSGLYITTKTYYSYQVT